MKVIKHLWEDLSEYLAGAKHAPFQRAFYKQALQIPAIGPQTRAQANKVIEVLKQRVQRELNKKLAPIDIFAIGTKSDENPIRQED
jgi:hypothetical protein